MNKEKAREFFSNYYEGTLEPGLNQALEQALARDVALKDEYREFELTYEDLGGLKFEAIEIPFDLNEKILANIDRHIYENKRAQQPGWTTWLRNFSIAGVSAVAVLGAFLSYRNATSKTSSADVLSTGSAKDEMTIEPLTNREATIHFAPNTTKVLTIHEGLGGPEVRRNTVLDGKELDMTLDNPKADAAVFDVEVQDDAKPTLIALPGSDPMATKTGQGDLEAFARALAGYYKVPVEIHVATPTVNVSWDFVSPDPTKAAMGALDLQQYNVSRKDNNLIVISD